MIYLYTGSNGSGKTLNVIKFIEEVLNKDHERQVFYFAPPDQPLNPNSDFLDWSPLTVVDAQNWFDYPQGSIFLIDECRHVFPFRPNNRPIPDFVDRLSEHRSKGYDFVLTAQKPSSQFDPAIQGFIEEHRHLVAKNGMNRSTHYIYQSFCSSPLNPPALQDVDTQSIPFDKKYFDYYRSASIHTKVKRTPYKQIFLYSFLLILLLSSIIYAYRSITSFNVNTSDSVDHPKSSSISTMPMLSNPENSKPKLSPEDEKLEYLTARIPRVPELPYTAPIYDALTIPKDFPRIAACIRSERTKSCSCYTQQATKINVNYLTCVNYVKQSTFNPFKQPENTKKQFQQQSGQSIQSSQNLITF